MASGRCEVPAVRRVCQGDGHLRGLLSAEIHFKNFGTDKTVDPSHRRQRSGNFVSNPAEAYDSYMRQLILPAAFVEVTPAIEAFPLTTFERHFLAEGAPIYRLELRKVS